MSDPSFSVLGVVVSVSEPVLRSFMLIESQACHPIPWISPGPFVGWYKMNIHVNSVEKARTVVTGVIMERRKRRILPHEMANAIVNFARASELFGDWPPRLATRRKLEDSKRQKIPDGESCAVRLADVYNAPA